MHGATGRAERRRPNHTRAIREPSGPARLTVCASSSADLAKHSLTADVGYIQKAIGLSAEQLPPANIPPLLKKMMLDATLEGDHTVHVTVPIT